MHKPLTLIGNLGRTPAEPRDKPIAQKNAAGAIAHAAAKAFKKAPREDSQQDRSAEAANDRLFSVPPIDVRSAAFKALRTLAAEYALAGYELIDEVGIDGARRLYAVRDGQTQPLDSIDTARAHLAQIADHQ
jgi:hypothetical protein